MFQRGLYAITQISLNTQASTLAAQVQAAIDGGAVMIQYRDKVSEPEQCLILARQLQSVCQHNNVPLIINDDVDLAVTVGAAGVHVGQTDSDVSTARAQLGATAIIGASCYNSLARAADAVNAGASYLAFGSFFPSRTKPNAALAELTLLTAARARFALPLVAIGGISAGNAHRVVAAGADMVAVISDVFNASDIRAAAQELTNVFRTINKKQIGQ